MSRILHDFRCSDGHVHEEYVSSECTEIPCLQPGCALLASRVFLVAPRVDWLSLGASPSASPEAINKFEKMHKEQKAKEEKCFKEHGDYGPRPGAD